MDLRRNKGKPLPFEIPDEWFDGQCRLLDWRRGEGKDFPRIRTFQTVRKRLLEKAASLGVRVIVRDRFKRDEAGKGCWEIFVQADLDSGPLTLTNDPEPEQDDAC